MKRVLPAIGFFLVCLLQISCSANELSLTLELEAGGTLSVKESWKLDPDQRENTFKRTVYLKGWAGRFPLSQVLVDVTGPISKRLNYGSERSYFEFQDSNNLEFSYRIRGATKSSGSGSRADYTLRLYDTPFALSALSVSLLNGTKLQSFVYDQEFESNLFSPPSLLGKGEELITIARGVPQGRAVRLVVEAQVFEESSSVLTQFFVQFAPALGLLGVAFVLTLVLKFTPPGLTVAGVQVFNLLTVAVVAFLLWPMAHYDILAPQYAGLEWFVNLISVLLVYTGLLGILLSYVIVQNRYLRDARPEAYTLQFCFPVLLFLFAPAAQVVPSFLFLWVAGVIILGAWSLKRLGRHLGAASHLIVELVETEGEIELSRLAKEYGVGLTRLKAILRHQTELPVVIDFQQEKAFSPSTAALQAKLSLCTHCGGATEVKGQQLLKCPYCDREYASSRVDQPHRPVPTVVRAYATFFRTIGLALGGWTAILVVVGFLDELLHSGFVDAVVYSGIVALVGGLLACLPVFYADSLESGEGYLFLLFSLGLLTPSALRTERVRLHFGVSTTEALAQKLRSEGQMTLGELARFLQCSLVEAAELTRFFVASESLPGVYDRVGEQLVAADRFKQLEHYQGCRSCGGLMGISNGIVACQYCGRAPSGS